MKIRTLSCLEYEEKLIIGVKEDFWCKRTSMISSVLVLCCFSIPYGLILFLGHYKGNNCVDM